VSSSIEKVTLEDLVQWSDAIVLVRKAKPEYRQVKWAFPKPSKETFLATEYAFHVVKVVRDEDSLIKGKTLRVFSASDEGNYAETWNEINDRPVHWLIHRQYDGEVSPDKEKKLVIFVRYNKEKKRFSFTAGGAYEREDRIGEILGAGGGGTPVTPK
jgi:hypothetical protein